MNGVALALALAVLAVDYDIRPAEDGKLEYVIQIEPEFLKSLAEGQVINSDVPPDAGDIERVLIRVGMTPARHSQPNLILYRNLLVEAGRYASTNPARAGVDGMASIIWPAKTKPELNYIVKYGWQPGQGDVLDYFVQINPGLITTLDIGDEIRAGIDPAARRVGRFVVRVGSDELPHIPMQPAATPFAEGTGGRGRTQGGAKPPVRGVSDQYAGAGSSAYGPAPSTQAPGGRPATPLKSTPDYSAGFGSATLPDPTPFGPAPRGTLEASGPAANWATGLGNPAQEPARSREYGPPVYDDSRFGRGNTTIQPPASNQYAPPAGYDPRTTGPQSQVPMATNYQQAQDYTPQNMQPVRIASNTRPATTNASGPLSAPQITSGDTARPLATAATADKPWFTMVVAFALFMSIGGNLYLGWTAAEYHSRYRLATERLRSAGRG